MPRRIDLDRLQGALSLVKGIRFAVMFGSARAGVLPKPDSDVDIAVALDHPVELHERASLIGSDQDALGTDRVDLVLIQESDNWVLH
jgi:predicted nucleotidyltransferase